MPLIHCSACGHQVSDAAPACPQCGNPVRKSRKVLWISLAAVFIVGFICVVILIAAMASSSTPSSSTGNAAGSPAARVEPPPPEANFKIVHVGSNDDCTEIGDYCVRALCTYLNVGNGPGDKTISSALLDSGTPVATRESTLTLMPNATKEVVFNFSEAEMDDDNNKHHYTVRCSSE